MQLHLPYLARPRADLTAHVPHMQHVFFPGSSNEVMIAWMIFDFNSSDHENAWGMCSRELLFVVLHLCIRVLGGCHGTVQRSHVHVESTKTNEVSEVMNDTTGRE